MTDASDVTVYLEVDYLPEQEDSAFYTDATPYTFLGKITLGEKNLSIYCVGEMRLLYYKNNDVSDYPDTLRYWNDLIAVGIDTDEKLSNYTAEMLEKNHEVWVNNSWYEICDEYGECLEICHELTDAIDFAVSSLLT